MVSPMPNVWTRQFEVVMRPLRDRNGAQSVVILETRTAAQASREATARFPEMKVLSVSRVASENDQRVPAASGVVSKVDESEVTPLRNTGSR